MAEAGDPGAERAAQVAALLAELRRGGIGDERVLAALARVPRERFVPGEGRAAAWANVALPIGAGQTISQPFIVALMTEALALGGGERVLEVGTGSGYQTAVLAELVAAGAVVSVERHAALSAGAGAILAELGYANVALHVGDGSAGWPAGAPYDRIVVTAAGPRVPPALLDQLVPAGGRLVIPIGEREADQRLILVAREGEAYQEQNLGPVRFVPLVGRAGWAPPTGENGHHEGGSGR